MEELIIEKIHQMPQNLQQEVLDFANYLLLKYNATNGNFDPEALDILLEKVVKVNPFRAIENPVEWQQKQRSIFVN